MTRLPWSFIRLSILSLLLTFGSMGAAALSASGPASQMPAALAVPPAAQASAQFDAAAATDAWLAQLSPAARARSDAYSKGGYWLLLWDFLAGAAIALLLLHLRWSAGMRALAERLTRFQPLQTLLYWIQYLLMTTLLGFPLAVYEGYGREHHYSLATQTFGPWMVDQIKSLLVGMLLGGIISMALFGVVRRLQRTWWIWGAVVAVAFTAFVTMIAPVYLVPIFNRVTRLDDPRVTGPILSMARANGIPAKEVYVVDASRQTTRVSADVSGLGSTMRITLNDNLLRRGTPEQIQAVVGHEMGHYVLNHIYTGLMFYLIVIIAGFAWLRWALERCLRRWGERWQIRGVGDTAVLPLAMLLVSAFFFALTPVLNSFSRLQEVEADIFGLNASRQPDGVAQMTLQVAEYRKLSPGPVEEMIFYDHPSGRSRIYAAMRWKAENLASLSARSEPPPASGAPAPK
jgi:STE24 endopeptidase